MVSCNGQNNGLWWLSTRTKRLAAQHFRDLTLVFMLFMSNYIQSRLISPGNVFPIFCCRLCLVHKNYCLSFLLIAYRCGSGLQQVVICYQIETMWPLSSYLWNQQVILNKRHKVVVLCLCYQWLAHLQTPPRTVHFLFCFLGNKLNTDVIQNYFLDFRKQLPHKQQRNTAKNDISECWLLEVLLFERDMTLAAHCPAVV